MKIIPCRIGFGLLVATVLVPMAKADPFQEVRTRLGMDGQGQWKGRAIARTTPCLLGLFSLVTLAAHRIQANSKSARRLLWTAWYKKDHPSFSHALAWGRSRLWREENF